MQRTTNLTQFVARFTESTSVDAVIAKAKAANISLTRDQVHRIRWQLRQRKAAASPGATTTTTNGTKRHAVRPTIPTGGSDRLKLLRRAMLCAGTDVSAAVLEDLRRLAPAVS